MIKNQLPINLITTFISSKLKLDLTTSMLIISLITPILTDQTLYNYDFQNFLNLINVYYILILILFTVLFVVCLKYKYSEDDNYNSLEVHLIQNGRVYNILDKLLEFESYHPNTLSNHKKHIISKSGYKFPQYGTKIFFNDKIHNVTGYITSKILKIKEVVDSKDITKEQDVYMIYVKENIDIMCYISQLGHYNSTKITEALSTILYVQDYCNDGKILNARSFFNGKKDPEKNYKMYMDSFFFPNKTKIWNYLNTAKNNPDFFNCLGQSSQFNMILHGPPGTGKSTFAYRLALCLFMDIYVVNISSYLNDPMALKEHLEQMPDKIVLLDEFDNTIKYLINEKEKDKKLLEQSTSYIESSAKDPKNKKLEIEDLLGIFQGAIPCKGRIIIATTNHFDFIYDKCPALLRSGRLTPVKFDYLDLDTLQELSLYYFNQKLSFSIKEINIPTSQIIELALESKIQESFTYFEDKLKELLTNS